MLVVIVICECKTKEPECLEHIKEVRRGEKSITLTFELPSLNKPIPQFVSGIDVYITYKKGNVQQQITSGPERITTTTESSYTRNFTGLKPGVVYTFKAIVFFKASPDTHQSGKQRRRRQTTSDDIIFYSEALEANVATEFDMPTFKSFEIVEHNRLRLHVLTPEVEDCLVSYVLFERNLARGATSFTKYGGYEYASHCACSLCDCAILFSASLSEQPDVEYQVKVKISKNSVSKEFVLVQTYKTPSTLGNHF